MTHLRMFAYLALHLMRVLKPLFVLPEQVTGSVTQGTKFNI